MRSGTASASRTSIWEGTDGVDRVVPITKPYKLASSQFRHGVPTVIEIDGRKIGGGNFSLMAGPCTVESREQLLSTAEAVKQAGGSMLRGGAYKPRTSPYSFQGLGGEGLRLLREAKEVTGLPIVTELMDARDVEAVLEVADVIQVGARNMQNYSLLAEIGRSGRAVLIKRGLAATLEELLMAAEYVLKEGNEDVILCERGIRTFETATRFTLDIMAIPVLKQMSHLPVVVDRATPRAGVISCCRCRWRQPRRAPTGSSSRSTTTPRRRSATVPRRCRRTSSAHTWSRSSGWRKRSGTSCQHSEKSRHAMTRIAVARRGPDRRLDRSRGAAARRGRDGGRVGP